MTTEQRLSKLEKTVNALIISISNAKFYTDTDIEGISKVESTHDKDIIENRQGVIESFENGLINAEDIADVRTALEEVYEMINVEE